MSRMVNSLYHAAAISLESGRIATLMSRVPLNSPPPKRTAPPSGCPS